jgi:enoyl-CoA hydratase
VQVNELAEGVLQLTIDNEARRNALDWQVCRELEEAVEHVAGRSDCRAVIVTGAGRAAFCSGADLIDIFADLPPSVGETRLMLKQVYRSFLAIRSLDVPTIAAVRGAAVGAGVNLAMCCDIVLTEPSATFAVPFARLGLHPGGGASYFLVQAMGYQKALRLLLTGGSLTGEEAVRWGLAASVETDLMPSALDLAQRIAQLDKRLVADIKHSVRSAVAADLQDVIEFESWAQAASAASNPRLEAAIRRHGPADGRRVQ